MTAMRKINRRRGRPRRKWRRQVGEKIGMSEVDALNPLK